MKFKTIGAYNAAQDKEDRRICDTLQQEIDHHLSEADSRIWHAHPVWFLESNPIVGYGKLKDCVRLMFWSGQSFDVSGLEAEGSFKAATVRYTSDSQVGKKALKQWLEASRLIQWDYKNIVKRKGKLIRLC